MMSLGQNGRTPERALINGLKTCVCFLRVAALKPRSSVAAESSLGAPSALTPRRLVLTSSGIGRRSAAL